MLHVFASFSNLTLTLLYVRERADVLHPQAFVPVILFAAEAEVEGVPPFRRMHTSSPGGGPHPIYGKRRQKKRSAFGTCPNSFRMTKGWLSLGLHETTTAPDC